MASDNAFALIGRGLAQECWGAQIGALNIELSRFAADLGVAFRTVEGYSQHACPAQTFLRNLLLNNFRIATIRPELSIEALPRFRRFSSSGGKMAEVCISMEHRQSSLRNVSEGDSGSGRIFWSGCRKRRLSNDIICEGDERREIDRS
jgi:hypothetical protein